jgi:hypothetical protein
VVGWSKSFGCGSLRQGGGQSASRPPCSRRVELAGQARAHPSALIYRHGNINLWQCLIRFWPPSLMVLTLYHHGRAGIGGTKNFSNRSGNCSVPCALIQSKLSLTFLWNACFESKSGAASAFSFSLWQTPTWKCTLRRYRYIPSSKRNLASSAFRPNRSMSSSVIILYTFDNTSMVATYTAHRLSYRRSNASNCILSSAITACRPVNHNPPTAIINETIGSTNKLKTDIPSIPNR